MTGDTENDSAIFSGSFEIETPPRYRENQDMHSIATIMSGPKSCMVGMRTFCIRARENLSEFHIVAGRTHIIRHANRELSLSGPRYSLEKEKE